MPSGRERPAREQETLVYPSPDQAREFREGLREQLHLGRSRSVRREREAVAEAVAEEMAQLGESPQVYRSPWEHTEAEHEEAQQLVDIAFAHDLPAALRRARRSPHYPRNLDLFHDVLTNEMYDLLKEHRLDRQPLMGWLLVVLGIILVVLLTLLFIVL